MTIIETYDELVGKDFSEMELREKLLQQGFLKKDVEEMLALADVRELGCGFFLALLIPCLVQILLCVLLGDYIVSKTDFGVAEVSILMVFIFLPLLILFCLRFRVAIYFWLIFFYIIAIVIFLAIFAFEIGSPPVFAVLFFVIIAILNTQYLESFAKKERRLQKLHDVVL